MINPNDEKAWGTYRTYRDDPVFEVSFEGDVTYPNGDQLPPVWITEPILDGEGNYDGRTYMMVYPYRDHEFPFPGHDDEDGEDALHYGGFYYDEGMGYADPAEHDKRVDCFRAAEVFFRHSVGNDAMMQRYLAKVRAMPRGLPELHERRQLLWCALRERLLPRSIQC